MVPPAERAVRVAESPRYRYPEELSADERAEVDRVLPVDGEAYLLWLAGDGPDPCLPESSG
jgi:hypothetical protein